MKLRMITKAEYLKGRDVQYPLDYTDEISDNIDQFLIIFNRVQLAYAVVMNVNSGWRPPSVNASVPGAARFSKHMIGKAIDINDPDDRVMKWSLANLDLLSSLELFLEDFRWCSTSVGRWVHFGWGSPKSGHRIFVPDASRDPDPARWDGVYDRKYDIVV